MKNSSGFTLVEALATMLVMSIGILGMGFVFSAIGRQAALSDRAVQANQLARAQLESVVSYKKSEGYSTIVSSNFPSRTVALGETTFTVATTISTVNSGLSNEYKKIDTQVTWPGNTSGAKMSTLVTNY